MEELLTLQDAGAPLPLKACNIKAELDNYLVGLNITLKYLNDNDGPPTKAHFRFPLRNAYFLLGAEATVDGKKIKTVVKRNSVAKKCLVDSAVASATAVRNRTDLPTWMPHIYAKRDEYDVFVFCLGNLPARSEAVIHLKLAGELSLMNENGEARFILPTFTKMKSSSGVSSNVPTECSFEMAAKALYVAELSSPTHALSIDKGKDIISVSLKESCAYMDNLVILVRHNQAYQVSHELGTSSGSDATSSAQVHFMRSPVVMVSYAFQHKVDDPASELIFLVDCSRSMKGSHLLNVKKAMALLLKSIPPDCTFNIFTFGATFSSLFKKSAEYNQESLQEAMKHVESFRADSGGEADLLSPLKHILSQVPFSHQTFILTAGFVGDVQACIDEASHKAKNCRFVVQTEKILY